MQWLGAQRYGTGRATPSDEQRDELRVTAQRCNGLLQQILGVVDRHRANWGEGACAKVARLAASADYVVRAMRSKKYRDAGQAAALMEECAGVHSARLLQKQCYRAHAVSDLRSYMVCALQQNAARSRDVLHAAWGVFGSVCKWAAASGQPTGV